MTLHTSDDFGLTAREPGCQSRLHLPIKILMTGNYFQADNAAKYWVIFTARTHINVCDAPEVSTDEKTNSSKLMQTDVSALNPSPGGYNWLSFCLILINANKRNRLGCYKCWEKIGLQLQEQSFLVALNPLCCSFIFPTLSQKIPLHILALCLAHNVSQTPHTQAPYGLTSVSFPARGMFSSPSLSRFFSNNTSEQAAIITSTQRCRGSCCGVFGENARHCFVLFFSSVKE